MLIFNIFIFNLLLEIKKVLFRVSVQSEWKTCELHK